MNEINNKRARWEARPRRKETEDEERSERTSDEQRAAARARELREGGLSLRRVAERLNAEAWPCRGSRWRHGSVGRLLASASASASESRLG